MAPKKKHRIDNDGGIKSRKMGMAVGAAVMILIGGGLAVYSPAFSPN